LTPFPHSKAWEDLEKEGRIIDRNWANYNAGNVVFQPRQMSADKMLELYHYAWDAFYQEESQYLKMGKLLLEPLKALRNRRRSKQDPSSLKL
ncbi:MAG: DUF4070 domain-containing protein, partial [bacterium]|nr:DUF4070 domain-containing protein [bacterium]